MSLSIRSTSELSPMVLFAGLTVTEQILTMKLVDMILHPAAGQPTPFANVPRQDVMAAVVEMVSDLAAMGRAADEQEPF